MSRDNAFVLDVIFVHWSGMKLNVRPFSIHSFPSAAFSTLCFLPFPFASKNIHLDTDGRFKVLPPLLLLRCSASHTTLPSPRFTFLEAICWTRIEHTSQSHTKNGQQHPIQREIHLIPSDTVIDWSCHGMR